MATKRGRGARAPAHKTATRKRAAKAKKPAPTKKVAAPPPGVYLSISQAAEEFGHDRRTVTKRVAELGLRPVQERLGYPVYRLRDLLEMERRTPDGKHDPDAMTPFERVAHFKAESERLKVDLERRELMRREDAEQEWARVLKLIALELDTVVDEVERDVGASPLVLEKIESKLDAIRHRVYDSIITDDAMEADDGAVAPG